MLKTTPTVSAGVMPKAIDDFTFLTLEVKLVFLQLRQAFTKAFILHHFDPEHYIWIKTDASGYVLGGILSQLNPKSGQ